MQLQAGGGVFFHLVVSFRIVVNVFSVSSWIVTFLTICRVMNIKSR